MAKAKSPARRYLTGYVKPTQSHTEQMQRETLARIGKMQGTAGKILVEDAGRSSRAVRDRMFKAISAASEYQECVVVPEVHLIADTDAEFDDVLGIIESKNIVLIEADTGHRSDKPQQLFRMIRRFRDFHEKRRLPRAVAIQSGKAGAAKRWEKHVLPKPASEIVRLWNDRKSYPNLGDFMDALNDGLPRKARIRSVATVYRWFKRAEFEKFTLLPRTPGRKPSGGK